MRPLPRSTSRSPSRRIVTLIEQRGDEAGKAAHGPAQPDQPRAWCLQAPEVGRDGQGGQAAHAGAAFHRSASFRYVVRPAPGAGVSVAARSAATMAVRTAQLDRPRQVPAGKWCPTCEQVKAVAEFGVNRRKRDGLSPRTPPLRRRRDAQVACREPAQGRAATRAHDAAHPEQRGARAAVARAILAGVLKIARRPARCAAPRGRPTPTTRAMTATGGSMWSSCAGAAIWRSTAASSGWRRDRHHRQSRRVRRDRGARRAAGRGSPPRHVPGLRGRRARIRRPDARRPDPREVLPGLLIRGDLPRVANRLARALPSPLSKKTTPPGKVYRPIFLGARTRPFCSFATRPEPCARSCSRSTCRSVPARSTGRCSSSSLWWRACAWRLATSDPSRSRRGGLRGQLGLEDASVRRAIGWLAHPKRRVLLRRGSYQLPSGERSGTTCRTPSSCARVA